MSIEIGMIYVYRDRYGISLYHREYDGIPIPITHHHIYTGTLTHELDGEFDGGLRGDRTGVARLSIR